MTLDRIRRRPRSRLRIGGAREGQENDRASYIFKLGSGVSAARLSTNSTTAAGPEIIELMTGNAMGDLDLRNYSEQGLALIRT
jgi:hypothetical protein